MATLNGPVVNFEDLFDFSPEPLEGPPSNEPQPPQHQVDQQQQSQTKQEQEEDTFLDLLGSSGVSSERVVSIGLGGEDDSSSKDLLGPFKLSQSVPTFWGRGGGANSGVKQESSDLNSSVGQLLLDLPEEQSKEQQLASSEPTAAAAAARGTTTVVKGKRGRKPGQKNLRTDMKSKLERSRQSARECRARKKLRYQYLDDLILEREKANLKLRGELLKYQEWCHELDKGIIPDGLRETLKEFEKEKRGGGS